MTQKMRLLYFRMQEFPVIITLCHKMTWHSNDDMKFLHAKIQQKNFCSFLCLIGVIVTLASKQVFLH